MAGGIKVTNLSVMTENVTLVLFIFDVRSVAFHSLFERHREYQSPYPQCVDVTFV